MRIGSKWNRVLLGEEHRRAARYWRQGVEAVAHAGETLLGRFRDGKLDVTPIAVTLVLHSIDRIKVILAGLEQTGNEPDGNDHDLIAQLEAMAEGHEVDLTAVQTVEVPDRPINGASVFVVSGGKPSGNQAATDADGHFELKGLTAGRYTVGASREGYVAADRLESPGLTFQVSGDTPVRHAVIRLVPV